MWLRSAKIIGERRQRWIAALDHVSIVIARNGEDRRGVMHIRFVKLRIIFARFAVIVNHITQVIEKGRAQRDVGIIELFLHCHRHDLLRLWSLHAAAIARHVEQQAARITDRRHIFRRQHLIQRQVIRWLSGWVRQWAERLVPGWLLPYIRLDASFSWARLIKSAELAGHG